MKKTYNIPTLTVVNIQPAQFIANSENVKVGSAYGTNDQKTVLSRQGSFSGYDEEE